MSEAREKLKTWLLEQVGAPYLWGAKGRLVSLANGKLVPAYDCSGFVTSALYRMGFEDWRQTHSAADLFRVLAPTEEPTPLDLCFYGPPSHVDHVVWWWGDGRVLSASGNHTCTDVETALRGGSCVKWKSRVDYRPDFRGYRRLPIP